MGFLYDFFYKNNFADNSSVPDNSESFEEVEEPTEEPEEVEEPTEESKEVQEPTEEPEEVEEPTEEFEEVEEPTEEPEEVEEPNEELEEVVDISENQIIVSYNGVSTPLFIDNLTITIFLLSVLIGVALFGIFKSKLWFILIYLA